MAATAETIDLAKQRWEQDGCLVAEIAREAGVQLRTVQRWAKRGAWTRRGNADATSTKQLPEEIASEVPPWPEDRIWPTEWTAEALEEMSVWRRSQARDVLAVIAMAQERNNPYIPWLYRLGVEVASDYPDLRESPRSEEWLAGIVGMRVLADWLTSPECDQLAKMMEEIRPWESGVMRKRGVRGRYARAAAPLATAIKDRLFGAAAMAVMDEAQAPLNDGRGLPVFLHALAERTPMIDRSPLLSLYRKYSVWALFRGILLFPKGGTK